MPFLANLVIAFAMGTAIAVYLPILSQTARLTGSNLLANVPFFLMGMVTSLGLMLGAGGRLADFGRLREVPLWMFLAGVVSAMMILGTNYLIPRIGPGTLFVLIVAGQIVTGTALSHFGWLGAPLDAVTLRKLAGICMVLAGAWVVSLR